MLYGHWATKELCGNVNFTTDTKVKTLSFLHHITHKMDHLRAKFATLSWNNNLVPAVDYVTKFNVL